MNDRTWRREPYSAPGQGSEEKNDWKAMVEETEAPDRAGEKNKRTSGV